MSELDSLYQQIILEHAKAKHGFGLGEGTVSGGQGRSHQLNPVCGDEVTVVVGLDGGRIKRLRWEGAGCSISTAAASVLHGLAEGSTEADFRGLLEAFRSMLRSRGTIPGDPDVLGDAAAFEGVSRYAARVKCAMISWVAAEEALEEALSASEEEQA